MSTKSNRSFSSSANMMGMEKSPSSRSPRAQAHPLTTSSKKNSKRSRSRKTKRSSFDSSDMESVGSFLTNGSSKKLTPTRPSAKLLSPSSKLLGGQDNSSQMFLTHENAELQQNVKLLQVQLSEILEENQFLKSRLSVELKEKHLLEAKNRELNKNLTESKKVLQDTGAALMQVHKQTNELKNKRDERELQLNDALFDNKELKRQVSELEREVEAMRKAADSSATISSFQRMLADKEELLRSMEEEHGKLQSQMFKLKRDYDRLQEEKEDATHATERQQRRVLKLEKTITELQDELSGAEKMLTSRSNYLLSGLNSINGSFALPSALQSPHPQRVASAAIAEEEAAGGSIGNMTKVIEGLVQSVEGRSKTMEDRMAVLESQLTSSLQRLNSYDDFGARERGASALAPTAAAPASAQASAQPAPTPASVATDSGHSNTQSSDIVKTMAVKTTEQAFAEAAAHDALFNSSSVVDIAASPHKDLDGAYSAPVTAGTVERDVSSAQSKRSVVSPAVGSIKARDRARNDLSGSDVDSTKQVFNRAADGNKESRKEQSNASPSTAPTVAAPAPAVAAPAAVVAAPAPVQAAERASAPVPAVAAAASPAATAPVEAASHASTVGVEETPSVATVTSAAPVEANALPVASSVAAPSTVISRREVRSPPAELAATSPPPSTAERIVKRYSAVNGSAPVAATSQPKKAQESNDEYISRLQSDKKRIKKDIFVWTKDFYAKNSRQPSKQERELLAGPMFKAYRNNAKLLKEAGVGESTKLGSIDTYDDMSS